jgi:predicted metal-dependent hydrolase
LIEIGHSFVGIRILSLFGFTSSLRKFLNSAYGMDSVGGAPLSNNTPLRAVTEITEQIRFQELEVTVIRAPRRSRMSVVVKPCGEIRLYVRKGTSHSLCHELVREWEPWIRKRLEEVRKLQYKYPFLELVSGNRLPYLGQLVDLHVRSHANYRKISFRFNESDQLILSLPDSFERIDSRERYMAVKRVFQAFYKKNAKALLTSRIEYWSKKMNLSVGRLSFRNQKTVWGSCSPEGNISLNWKLLVFPLSVIDYVVIHELAHIEHKNHSKSFWALVRSYDPRYMEHKKFLADHHLAVDFLSTQSELYPLDRVFR